MSGRVRSHRRDNPVVVGLVFGGLAVVALTGLVLFRVGLYALGEVTKGIGCVALIAVALAVSAGRHVLRRREQRRAARELARWGATSGWEPATLVRRWPWQAMVRWADTVSVLRAYTKRVAGFPVVTGELAFTENGLGETVDRREGHAAFAVVTLPRPAPARAVRAYRVPHRRRPGEDEFRRRFHVLGPELDDPRLRAAHVSGELPPWTVTGDELFVFVPLDGPLRPHDLEETTRKAIEIVSRSDR